MGFALVLTCSFWLLTPQVGRALDGERLASEYFLYDQKRMKEVKPRGQLGLGGRSDSEGRAELVLSLSPASQWVSHVLGASHAFAQSSKGFPGVFYEMRWPRNGISFLQVHWRGAYLFEPERAFELWYGASLNAFEINEGFQFLFQAEAKDRSYQLGGLLTWSL